MSHLHPWALRGARAPRELLRALALALSVAALWLALAPRPAHGDDGVWLEWDPPTATNAFQSAVFDPSRQELVVLPGLGATDGGEYWTCSLSGVPIWTRHRTGLPFPGARTGGFVVLDTARDRLIQVGGVGSPVLPGQADEVWALSLASGTWSQLALVTKRTVNGAAGIYDPVGDRIVMLHDWWQVSTDGLWTLPLSSDSGWVRVDMMGAYSTCHDHTAIYDPVGRRMLVYGGAISSESGTDPIVIDLDDPPQLHHLGATGTPPPELNRPSAVYDPIGARMIVCGGSTTNSTVWALSLGDAPEWTTLTGGAPTDPARQTSAVAFDPVHDEMVMFGGTGPDGLSNDCWGLDLSLYPLWVPLTGVNSAEPPARNAHSAVADLLRDRMLVFGGLTAGGLNNFQLWAHGWGSGSPWQLIPTLGPAPGALEPLLYDSKRDRLLGSSSNSIVALSLGGSGTLHWTILAPSGTPPSTRKGVATAWDPVSDRLFVFGGRLINGGGQTNTYLNDLWSVNLSGAPAWTKLNPPGALPPARTSARLVLDGQRGRLLLVGGADASGQFRDLWQFPLGASPQWTELVLGGLEHPSPTAAAIDSVEDRVLALSGTQLWELPLAGSPAWRALYPTGGIPPPRSGASLAYDAGGRQAVLFGGLLAGGSVRANDLWSDLFPPPSAAVPLSLDGDFRLAAWPNPARGHLDLSFTLARAGRVRLELADIAGRRVRELDAGELGAGSHVLRLNAGIALPAGLYFATLRTAEGTRSAKVVIVQ